MGVFSQNLVSHEVKATNALEVFHGALVLKVASQAYFCCTCRCLHPTDVTMSLGYPGISGYCKVRFHIDMFSP